MADQLQRTARSLVEPHREAEPNLRRIIFYPDPEGLELRLLEVVDGSPSLGEAYPFRFAPDEDHGVPYPLVLVEMSPDEYDAVRNGQLALPAGWNPGLAEVLFEV